jgi:hypothetical protein
MRKGGTGPAKAHCQRAVYDTSNVVVVWFMVARVVWFEIGSAMGNKQTTAGVTERVRLQFLCKLLDVVQNWDSDSENKKR